MLLITVEAVRCKPLNAHARIHLYSRICTGGQLLLIMVEAARGKPLNADLTRTVNGVFLTLLLCVSLSLLIGDIERLIPASVITGIENLLGLAPSL